MYDSTKLCRVSGYWVCSRGSPLTGNQNPVYGVQWQGVFAGDGHTGHGWPQARGIFTHKKTVHIQVGAQVEAMTEADRSSRSSKNR